MQESNKQISCDKPIFYFLYINVLVEQSLRFAAELWITNKFPFLIISFKKRVIGPFTFVCLVNDVLCLRAFRLVTKSYQNILKGKKWL